MGKMVVVFFFFKKGFVFPSKLSGAKVFESAKEEEKSVRIADEGLLAQG